MVAATPSTIRILKTFDPTTLPTAISNSFFLAATMDVTSSGKDVPTEQMVSPTSVALIPKLVAMVEAESTTQSPPYLIAIGSTYDIDNGFPDGLFFHFTHLFVHLTLFSEISPRFLASIALLIKTTINPTKMTKKTIPSIRPSSMPMHPQTSSRMAHSTENG